ncbi:67aa long hypothetical protein [Pyrococcus horikoshii OT3]|uniref:Uncharacterized protein n=2 Tax=Pyrococcus horikoshii TaxID=53953 RepID=O73967_PYRHO|nr:Chain B, Crystal structure of archaeal RelE-RelB complex from Pyrococcus horikoshii OT3 [Pyrococcus horikoshii OT3]1WMI_D Chain D, Crystal structure of archaeal RelE-RelB complex from Pyrococcus horikoshii OT3 [Pyrococcus horikoshii OT3]BAA29491.1 67aa long hypothetical protein [Pyrococcus horikoshii OT3]
MRMEKVGDVLKELERLKVEIQRLEAMLMPEERDEDITEEEIAELLELARDEDPENWIDAEELPEPED